MKKVITILLALSQVYSVVVSNEANRKCLKKKGINVEDCKLEDLIPDDGAPGGTPNGTVGTV